MRFTSGIKLFNLKKLTSAKIHQIIYDCVQAKPMINNNSRATIIISSGNNAGRWLPTHVSLGKNKNSSCNPISRIHL